MGSPPSRRLATRSYGDTGGRAYGGAPRGGRGSPRKGPCLAARSRARAPERAARGLAGVIFGYDNDHVATSASCAADRLASRSFRSRSPGDDRSPPRPLRRVYRRRPFPATPSHDERNREYCEGTPREAPVPLDHASHVPRRVIEPVRGHRGECTTLSAGALSAALPCVIVDWRPHDSPRPPPSDCPQPLAPSSPSGEHDSDADAPTVGHRSNSRSADGSRRGGPLRRDRQARALPTTAVHPPAPVRRGSRRPLAVLASVTRSSLMPSMRWRGFGDTGSICCTTRTAARRVPEARNQSSSARGRPRRCAHRDGGIAARPNVGGCVRTRPREERTPCSLTASRRAGVITCWRAR